MKWSKTIVQGTFQRRYKRFFADVELDGQTVVAHVPNTGTLKGCIDNPCEALLSESDNPERKLKYTLEALKTPSGAWVGVNTTWPNQLVREAFEQKLIPEWREFSELQLEVKINPKTRLDGLLKRATGTSRYFEVKNVTLADGDVAQFPDAVTERGQKHLRELMELVKQGHEAEIVFVVQRTDCRSFQPAAHIDPDYANLLAEAVNAGVIVRVLAVQVTPEGLELRPAHFSYT